MTSFGKKIATALFAGALALTGIAGCSPAGAAEPTNTAELLERYDALTDKDNAHMDFNMSMGLELFGSTMDITMDGSYDMAGKNAHGTMSMDLLGEAMDIESYVETGEGSYVQYAGYTMDNETSWVKQTYEGEFITDSVASADVLKDAEFAKTDSGYTLTADGSAMVSALSALGGSNVLGGMDEESAKEMFKDTTMVYTFDKTYHLTGATMEMNYSAEESGMSYAMTLSLDCKYSNFGTVDAASVTVPEDIKASAFDNDALNQDLTDLANGLEALAEETSSATSATETSSAASTAETSSVAAAA